MTPPETGLGSSDQVARVASKWRQGDVALDAQEFMHVKVAAVPVHSNLDLEVTEVKGLVVLTQTCDLARPESERRFVETAPLVEILDEEEFLGILRRERPRYAAIPTLREQRLVADLDRVMTVEKSVLASWTRTPGWETDEDDRRFREALARKRSRAAFEDDFVEALKPLRQRIRKKHDRNTLEGRALRSIGEIRVRAAPSWSSSQVEIHFWFILGDKAEVSRAEVSAQVDEWLDFLEPDDRYVDFDGLVVALEDMKASDYTESDRLDLGDLTMTSDSRV